MRKKKNEASRVANVVTPDSTILQGFAGSHFDPSFRTKGSDSPVQRHRKKHPSKKPLKHRSPNETPTFRESVVASLLGLNEVVRKQGNQWVVYDDKSGVQIGAYKTRKAAWTAQRVRRQQNKFRKKNSDIKKPVVKPKRKMKAKVKPAKAQVKQIKKTPKVKNVKGVKKIKAISPIKPIRPKGLRAKRANESCSFTNAIVSGLLDQ